MSDTTPVVAVKLRYSPRSYWFDPVLGEYSIGDSVLVETERGREVGRISAVGINATETQIGELSSPLKPVIRILDEKDIDQQERLDEKSESALVVFHELVLKSELDIKPVAVEYLFTGDKAVFYFASEVRVDFRELVRDLAARLHIRVELRQIGVRDEARMLGGISHCGEQLCCARIGSNFQPVSIRMAKEQDLPLNPEKISGVCGRLMCCLRYEFEAYRDFKSRAPKYGAEIATPLGKAKVTDYNTPRESVTIQLEDGKPVTILLSDFEQPDESKGESTRPDTVGREAFERSASSNVLLALSSLDREGEVEELAKAEADSAYSDTRRRRNRRDSGSGSAGGSSGSGNTGRAGNASSADNSSSGNTGARNLRANQNARNAATDDSRASNTGTTTAQSDDDSNSNRTKRRSNQTRNTRNRADSLSTDNSQSVEDAPVTATGATGSNSRVSRRNRQRAQEIDVSAMLDDNDTDSAVTAASDSSGGQFRPGRNSSGLRQAGGASAGDAQQSRRQSTNSRNNTRSSSSRTAAQNEGLSTETDSSSSYDGRRRRRRTNRENSDQ